jgi:integrase
MTTFEDSRVIDFLESREKESTRNIYGAGIAAFQTFYEPQGTITDFLDRVDDDLLLSPGKRTRVAANTLRDFIKDMKAKKLSAKTINTYTNGLRSLVSFIYDGEFSIRVKNLGLPDPEAESEKTPWTLDLISKFIGAMKQAMYRALAAVIFQSGQGLEEILSLKYKDIQAEFEKGISPLRLELKRKKTGVRYFSFIGSAALELLRRYFEATGTPAPESRLFPIEKESVERYFARLARKFIPPWTGFCPMRPHSLRAAFNKLLIRGRCPEIFVEFWMGHSIEKNKDAYVVRELGPEEWRVEYRNFEPALTFKIISRGSK